MPLPLVLPAALHLAQRELLPPAASTCAEHYSLRPHDLHTLSWLAEAPAYRLVAVLYYQRNTHFIADVLDPRDDCWLRFDGMDPRYHGRGVPVAAPTGRTSHLGGSYFRVVVVYVLNHPDAGVCGDGDGAQEASELVAARRQSHMWRANSCYVDASLTVWEYMQRWL